VSLVESFDILKKDCYLCTRWVRVGNKEKKPKNAGLVLLKPERRSDIFNEFVSFAHTRIAEQDRMVRDVARALERACAGLNDPRKPLGSFLFLGPSGAGKTLLVQTLAEFLFGDRDGMMRIDGQSFYDKHVVAGLLGSPMGYIGHDDEPRLTQEKLDKPAFEAIKKDFLENISAEKRAEFLKLERELRGLKQKIQALKASKTIATETITETEEKLRLAEEGVRKSSFPSYDPKGKYLSILLFDEIGRAHQSLCDVVLRILDEGVVELLSGAERKKTGSSEPSIVRFKHCFIFATANEGWSEIAGLLRNQSGITVKMGFEGSANTSPDAIDDDIYALCHTAAQKKFGTPFLNRFRVITAARPLSRKGFERALDIEISRLQDLLVKEWNLPIILKVSKNARTFLVNEATDKPEEQARLVGKKLEHHITDKLAALKLTGQLKDGDVLEVRFRRPRKLLFYKRNTNNSKRLMLPSPSRVS